MRLSLTVTLYLLFRERIERHGWTGFMTRRQWVKLHMQGVFLHTDGPVGRNN
jgi:hypothetical protein